MTMTRVSERREVLTLAVGYIGVWVDGVQIAAAIREGTSQRWSLWSPGLKLRERTRKGQRITDKHAVPLTVEQESDARAWLDLLADIAEDGPHAVETRTLPANIAAYQDESDPWSDDPDFPPSDWHYEVGNGDTRLGYADWKRQQRAMRQEVQR